MSDSSDTETNMEVFSHLLLIWIKIIVLSSNDLWDEAGRRGTANCGRGQGVLGKRKKKKVVLGLANVSWKKYLILTFHPQNLHYQCPYSHQVCGIVCLWRVAGVYAVPGSALWAGARAVWRSKPESPRDLENGWYKKLTLVLFYWLMITLFNLHQK